MRINSRIFSLASALLLSSAALASADDLTPQQMAEARAKVQTAVELARMAEETKDGDMMLVAARLMATVGPVAMSASKAGERPPMFDVKKMAARAKELGADPVKADGVAVQPSSSSYTPSFWQQDYCPAGYNCTMTWVY